LISFKFSAKIKLSENGSPATLQMPIKRPPFVNREIYHIIIRAVGDTLIFREEADYYRGIYAIYEFNTNTPVEIRTQRHLRRKIKIAGEPFSDTRNPFVETLSFCLMPNHIHLLLRQLKDRGISDFIRKFGAGEAGYFNKKYSRKGPLFAKFRAVHIKDDNQLNTIFVYIHCNPISIIEPGWKETGIKNVKLTENFLENYRWSSYQDYIGKKNFPSVTKRNFLSETLGGETGCREIIKNWIEYRKGIEDFAKISLE